MKKEFLVEEKDINKRLDVYLEEKLESFSRSQVKNLISASEVLINDTKPKKAGQLLKLNDSVIVKIELKDEQESLVAEDLPLDIIFEDEYLAVVNKAQGMVVHPAAGNHSGTLANALMHHFKNLSSVNSSVRPGIVHRLDKDTSGLLVIAKNDEVHKSLAEQIKQKTAKRVYRAIVSGVVKEDEGRIEKNLERSKKDRIKIAVTTEGRGKTAITDYKVLARFDNFSYVEFYLLTGRTHQIRVHAKYIGHPVLGDATYGYNYKNIKLKGQLLHAFKLSFIHPVTNKFMTFEAPLPDYFEKMLKKLDN
jgi:23S rRNA pseudouridine1911/1915/1917 synthase